MQLSSFLLFAIFAVSTSRCAPALDAATLADNAKKAQELNTKFATLKSTDPCQGQETSCVGGDIATCVDGKFDTSSGKCPESQQCFAIPDIRAVGTSLLCTSESTVIGLINASGGSGGIAGSDNSTSPSTSSSSTSSRSTSTSTSTSSTGSPGDSSKPVTVTVTVLATPLSTTTTRTLSPSEASSILGKFLSDGPASPSSTSSSSRETLLTPAADPSSTSPPSPSGSVPTSSIVLLSAASNSTSSSSPDASPSERVVQISAAPEEPSPSAPTPAPTPNGVVVGGGGGGGGGGYGY